jgi:4-hydroxybenzoate polyprenyltransferase
MNQLQGYFRLFRLERAFSAVLGLLITGIVVKDLNEFNSMFVYASFSVFFSAIANFSLNDIHDVDIDKINKRNDKPLAVGTLKRKNALFITGFCFFLAIIFAFLLPITPQILIFVGLPLSLLYNVYLKHFLLLKNLFTGLANVGVILIGGILVDNHLEPMGIYLAIISFFFSLSYEIMLDIADVKGDKAKGVETIPSRFGISKATMLSVIIGLGAVVVNPIPFFICFDPRLFHDHLFLVLVLISVINRLIISINLLRDQSSDNIKKLKNRLFRNLQLGGFGYIIGILY